MDTTDVTLVIPSIELRLFNPGAAIHDLDTCITITTSMYLNSFMNAIVF